MESRWIFRNRLIRAVLRAGVGVSAGVGLLLMIVTFTPVLRWWTVALSGEWTDSKGDILIVPAGGRINETTLDPGSYWRTVYAAMAWREGFRRIVVSGGPSRAPMAELMKRALVVQGVPADAIEVEGESESTRENALFTARRLRGTTGRKILMTSDFHMRRCAAAFRKAGLDVVPRPIPDAFKRMSRWQDRWSVLFDLAEETAKISVYYVRRWI